MGPPSDGSPTRGRGQGGRVQCELGSSRRRRPWRSDRRLLKLALGTWNVTSLLGKEPELVCEAERFRLDIVELTSTHGLGSGTSPLERGWTLFHSGVAHGERRRASVGILIAPRLCACTLGFTSVDERVASLRLRVLHQTAVQSTHPFWSPWGKHWRVLLQETPSFCWGTSMLTWAMTVRPGRL